MIERTKSFITLSEFMFDLQHSKSNSPKRVFNFKEKTDRERERDSALTKLFKLNEFGILTC